MLKLNALTGGKLGNFQKPLSFRSKILLLLLVLMSLQMSFLMNGFQQALRDVVQDQVSTRALLQAEEIASDPVLIASVEARDVGEIGAITQRLSAITDASFIVIGDKQGIRLAHPTKEQIGLPMQGADNAGALELGNSYISVREGSLGMSVRGKTPIKNAAGEIIGVVSVGYLLDRFEPWLEHYQHPLLYESLATLLLTLWVAWLFARHIKRSMHNMEPAEIALSHYVQKSTLKSVFEGIVAVDKQGKILTINQTAKQLLNLDIETAQLKRSSIMDHLNQTQLFFHVPFEENLRDEMVSINGNNLIANRVAMFDQDLLIGWVVSFRRREEIHSLAMELTQIEQYAHNSRMIRDDHEQQLSTLFTLIEQGEYEASLAMISEERRRKEVLNDFIATRIKCPQVAEVLWAKSSLAHLLDIELKLASNCHLNHLNDHLDPNELSVVLGSLIDNAFESTGKNPESNRVVSLLITDAGKELVIEITDNGCGIDPSLATTIFSRGVSSKSDQDSGVGLYLINRYVTSAGGVILVDNALPKGSTFSIFIPINAA